MQPLAGPTGSTELMIGPSQMSDGLSDHFPSFTSTFQTLFRRWVREMKSKDLGNVPCQIKILYRDHEANQMKCDLLYTPFTVISYIYIYILITTRKTSTASSSAVS